MELPRYDPPGFQATAASLNDRVKEFLEFWDKRVQYDVGYFNRLRNVIVLGNDTSPYKSIASAATIKPLRSVQPVTGSVSVSTISVPTGFVQVTLLSIDGFSVNTSGNISVAKALPANTATIFFLNLTTNKWIST